MPWQYAGLEPKLDRWIDENDPPWEVRCDMIEWLLSIRDDPYRPGTTRVPGSMLNARVAPLPSSLATCFAYAVDDDARVITALLIETT